MKQILTFIVSSFVAVTMAATVNAGTSLLNENTPLGGWRGIGTGYADGTADMDLKEIQIDVIWSNATWGVGLLYALKPSINGKKVKAIKVEIRTVEGSMTKVIGGLASENNAHIAQNARLAEKITNTWRTVTFPVAEMRPDKPEKNSPKFGSKDWTSVNLVKLIFMKPESGEIDSDIIRVRNPELVME